MEKNKEQDNVFPWHYDPRVGNYIIFGNGEQQWNSHKYNTVMYLYPDHKDVNHIFILLENQGDYDSGVYLFEKMIDERLGVGVFQRICDEMHQNDFDCADEDKPSQMDYSAYERIFGELPASRLAEIEQEVGKIANLDAEINYYLKEWE